MTGVPDAVQRVALLRRAGTVTNAEPHYDPGSAAHTPHGAARCAASEERR